MEQDNLPNIGKGGSIASFVFADIPYSAPSGLLTPNGTGTVHLFDGQFGERKVLKVENKGDALEIVYRRDAPMWPSQKSVFKIIYTFDKETGKIVESEPIYAKIIPAQAESFTFENEQL